MTFSNSILAGEELVRTAIRSSNYVAGVSGWIIRRDGTFELNGGTFRGDVIITGANGSIRLGIDPTNGAVIDFLAGGHHWQIFAFAVGNQKSLVINDAISGGNVAIGLLYDTGTGQSFAEVDASTMLLKALNGAITLDPTTTVDIAGGLNANGTIQGSGNISASNDLQAAHDIESFGNGQGVIVHSVNGSRWRIGVTNSGALSIAAA